MVKEHHNTALRMMRSASFFTLITDGYGWCPLRGWCPRTHPTPSSYRWWGHKKICSTVSDYMNFSQISLSPVAVIRRKSSLLKQHCYVTVKIAKITGGRGKSSINYFSFFFSPLFNLISSQILWAFEGGRNVLFTVLERQSWILPRSREQIIFSIICVRLHLTIA